MKKKYDIGITGCWFGSNYGSLLNGYATYKIFKNLGQRVLLIQKPNAKPDDWELNNTKNSKFIEKYYSSEEVSPSLPYDRLNELNNLCDNFCVGSDQVWNPYINNSFHKTFMLNFANDDKKLISFATSFGDATDILPISEQSEDYKLLNRFSAISVREQFSVDICKNKFNIDAKLLFEPVFCVDKKIFLDLAANSKINESENYILTYILDPTPEKRNSIVSYSKKTNLKAINILDGFEINWDKNNQKLNLPNTKKNVIAEDFIKLFSNAKFIITDSFHGTAFSIIFNKPFLAVGNEKRGIGRFYDLLGRLNLLDRLAPDSKQIPNDIKFLEPIDYSQTEKAIEKERKKAIDWLKSTLKRKKRVIKTIPTPAQPNDTELERLNQNPDFVKIRLLATLLRDYGIKHIVLSPGGRDVPIVRMFENNENSFILHRVTDERSAAYYALGIAAQTRKPAVCVCTSGTAASNYLPAVTEAYYTGIPLIVITADRYEAYHNQGEDQTIPQKNIYNSVVKKSISLSEGSGYLCEYQTRRDISDCILETTHNSFGPVHINIPVNDIGVGSRSAKAHWRLLDRIYPHILRVGFNDGTKDMHRWVAELKKSKKILIVYGQNSQPSELQKQNIEAFASKYNCAIVTDSISNLNCKYSLNPHVMLSSITQEEFNKELSPDILISVGGKRLMNDPLTFKVRRGPKNIRHWSVTPDGKVKDFYFRLSSVIESSQNFFFEWFSQNAGDIKNNGDYHSKWEYHIKKHVTPPVEVFNTQYIQSKFLPDIPAESILHLGVGLNFFECRKYSINEAVEVYCNMGTNGIDGSTSTFMGQCAIAKDKLCFLIVGDLSFFYDMNSIWNKELHNNIRILMVNNNGSGLLRGNNLKAVTSVHNTAAEGWVKSTKFQYISAHSKKEFDDQLPYFMSKKSKKPLFFEVFCN